MIAIVTKIARECIRLLLYFYVSLCGSELGATPSEASRKEAQPEALAATGGLDASSSAANATVQVQTKEHSQHHFYKVLANAYQKDEQIKSVLLNYKGASLSPLSAIMAHFVPQFTAQGSMGHATTRETGRLAKNNYQTQGGSLRVTQNVFNGGAGIASYRTAVAAEKTGQLQYEKALQDFLVRALKSYVGVVTAQKTLEVSRSSEKSVGQQLEAAKVRAEVGEGTITDVALAEAELAKTATRRIQAEAELQISVARYQDMFGELPPADMSFPYLPELVVPKELSAMTEMTLKHNHDIQMLQLQADDAGRKATMTMSGMLPKVDVNATASRNRLSPQYRQAYGTGWQTSFGTDVTVTIPFINNGQTSNFPAIAQAQLNASSARRGAQYQKEQIRLKAIQLWETTNFLSKALAQNQAQVNAAKLRLEGVTEEFKVGARAMLDVMDAETKHLEAQVSLLQTEQRYIESIFDALQICAMLKPQALGIHEALKI